MTPFFSLITITTILLFLSLHPTISAFVLDIDGEPLVNTGASYIISKGHGGSLAPTQKSGEPPCPSYITRKPTSHGIPVRISSPLRIRFLPTSTRVSLIFQTNLTTCTGPLQWYVTADDATGRLYVVSGGTPTTADFSVVEAKNGGKKNTYKIRYCGDDEKCGEVGFFKENGLMGITNEIPLFAQFKQVNASGLLSM